MKEKRILISRTDKLGDFITCIPSFFMVKQMYPQCRLGVIAKGQNCTIAEQLPYIDKVYDVGNPDLAEELREFEADVYINLSLADQQVPKLIRKLRVPKRIGTFNLKNFYYFNKWRLDKRSEGKLHEAEHSLRLVEALDPQLFLEKKVINTELHYPPRYLEQAKKLLTYRKTILIHPFSSNSAVNLSPADYVRLLDTLRRSLPEVGFMVSAGQSERGELERFRLSAGEERTSYICNSGDILSLIALIDACDVFISCSTGPMHLAASLKKKVIAFFATTPSKISQVRWRGFGNEQNSLNLELGDYEVRDGARYFQELTEENVNIVFNFIKANI